MMPLHAVKGNAYHCCLKLYTTAPALSSALSLSLAGTLSISVRVCVPRAAAPALDTAIETAKIAFAPMLVLLGVPSTCVIAFPCDCVCYGTHVTYKYRRM